MNSSFFTQGPRGELLIENPAFSAGCVARAANRIDYNASKVEIRSKEKSLVSEITGVQPARIFFLDQDHKDAIVDIESPAHADQYCAGVADALTTALRGFVLVIRTADCVPVLIHDGKRNVIAAVHSGWRSSALDICGKTVRHMVSKYGTDPADCSAYVLPAIGVDSYQVSADVAAQFPGCVVEKPDGLNLNLNCSVGDSIRRAGIPNRSVFYSGFCTFEHNSLFFSHRKGDSARNLNYIVLL
mgnify:CR=1 FL=1